MAFPNMLHIRTLVYQKYNLIATICAKTEPSDGLSRSFLLSTTSCVQYARKTASNEGEIQQTTEIRLYYSYVPFHNDPAAENWWQISHLIVIH